MVGSRLPATAALVVLNLREAMNGKSATPRSRPSQAVEPCGIIRPLRVAKIKSAASEGVGLHGGPFRISQIRRGFDNNGEVCGPGDGETELVGSHAKAGVTGQDQRRGQRPQCCRNTAESRAPIGGSWEIIADGVEVTIERQARNGRSITLEIDSRQPQTLKKGEPPDIGDAVGDGNAGQAAAARERIVPDAGDVVGDRGAGQAAAALERTVPDAGDAVGDRNAGQAAAAIERIAPDAGDAVGDCVASRFALRILDEPSLALVEQHPINTAIGRVERLHRYRAEAGGARERMVPDVGDAVGDRDAGQAAAAKERTVPDAGDGPAIDCAGDGLRPARTGVSRDGDRAFIGRVIELGLHRGGQRQ